MAALLRNTTRSISLANSLFLNRKIQSQTTPSPTFNGKGYMTNKIHNINKALEEAIPLQHPRMLHEAMRYTLLAGGKRLLPLACIASCELVGGEESFAMPMACALEMIKTEGLILDDLPCMDNDDLRRGKPTNHKVFGESTSILASHALFCLAIEHIATNTRNVKPDRLVRAITEICTAVGAKGATAGQFMDIDSEGKEVSVRELEYIHRNKTAKFFETGVVCGALVGGGDEGEIERLRSYSECVGLAFQIWDDVLDITCSIEELGKTPCKDLVCDKATYPKLIGMEESKKLARELVSQGKEELCSFDFAKAAALYFLADFSISRSY